MLNHFEVPYQLYFLCIRKTWTALLKPSPSMLSVTNQYNHRCVIGENHVLVLVSDPAAAESLNQSSQTQRREEEREEHANKRKRFTQDRSRLRMRCGCRTFGTTPLDLFFQFIIFLSVPQQPSDCANNTFWFPRMQSRKVATISAIRRDALKHTYLVNMFHRGSGHGAMLAPMCRWLRRSSPALAERLYGRASELRADLNAASLVSSAPHS